MALINSAHHIRGSCSAKPIFGEAMSISVEGENAFATQFPVSISTSEHFTEDDPISTPSKYFMAFI
jgi:hypothetical protein